MSIGGDLPPLPVPPPGLDLAVVSYDRKLN